MTGVPDDCGGHPGLGAELRALALSALDRIEPVLERVGAEPATAAPDICKACPVCAIVAALRGERPELAVRLADQAVGLVAVLRDALEDGAPRGQQADVPPPVAPGRTVQRIPVQRVGKRR